MPVVPESDRLYPFDENMRVQEEGYIRRSTEKRVKGAETCAVRGVGCDGKTMKLMKTWLWHKLNFYNNLIQL